MRHPCPQCGRKYELRTWQHGQEVACPNCQTRFILTAPPGWSPEGGAVGPEQVVTHAAEPWTHPLANLADGRPTPPAAGLVRADPPADGSRAVRVRFSPAACPGCGAPVAARYSTYRHARHPLFGVLLVAGVVFTVGLGLFALWVSASLTALALDGWQMTPEERGTADLLAFATTLPGVWWLSRLWWRALHRLPRPFAYECGTCRWAGPCRVSEAHAEV